MNKKYIILIIVLIILLAIFFYPKQSNVWDDSFTVYPAKEFKNIDCKCIGFTGFKSGLSKSDTQIMLCYGMPIECQETCYYQNNDDPWFQSPCNYDK